MYKRQVTIVQKEVQRSAAYFEGIEASRPLQFLQNKQPSVEPVSYTHLRAHETVLDLVCRLLLEKKKINISEPTIH
ncbi:hypothetical protein PVA38_11040 [Streptococcus pneumoniae D39]|nr:hypothetical protein PVA38_11040 [Streptococcus pneumoniae D39]